MSDSDSLDYMDDDYGMFDEDGVEAIDINAEYDADGNKIEGGDEHNALDEYEAFPATPTIKTAAKKKADDSGGGGMDPELLRMMEAANKAVDAAEAERKRNLAAAEAAHKEAEAATAQFTAQLQGIATGTPTSPSTPAMTMNPLFTASSLGAAGVTQRGGSAAVIEAAIAAAASSTMGTNMFNAFAAAQAETQRLEEETKRKQQQRERERKVPPITLLHDAFFKWYGHSSNTLLAICKLVQEVATAADSESAAAMAMASSENAGMAISHRGNMAMSYRVGVSSGAGSPSFSCLQPSGATAMTSSAAAAHSDWVDHLPISIYDMDANLPTSLPASFLSAKANTISQLLSGAKEPGVEAIRRMAAVNFDTAAFDEEGKRPWSPATELLVVPHKPALEAPDLGSMVDDHFPSSPVVGLPTKVSETVLDFELKLRTAFCGAKPADILEEADLPPMSLVENTIARGITCAVLGRLLKRRYVDDEMDSTVQASMAQSTYGGTGPGGTLRGAGALQQLLAAAQQQQQQSAAGHAVTPIRQLVEALAVIAGQAMQIVDFAVSRSDVPVTLINENQTSAAVQEGETATEGEKAKLSGTTKAKRTVSPSIVEESSIVRRTYSDDDDDMSLGNTKPVKSKLQAVIKRFEDGTVYIDGRILQPFIVGCAAEGFSDAAIYSIKMLSSMMGGGKERLAAEWVCSTIFVRSDDFTAPAVRAATMAVAEAAMYGHLKSEDPNNNSTIFSSDAASVLNNNNNNNNGSKSERKNREEQQQKQQQQQQQKDFSWLKPTLSLLSSIVDRCNLHVTGKKTVQKQRRTQSKPGSAATTGPTFDLGGTMNFGGTMNGTAGSAGGSVTSDVIRAAQAAAFGGSNDGSSGDKNNSNNNSSATNYDCPPPDREAIEFACDVLQYAIAHDGADAFLRENPDRSATSWPTQNNSAASPSASTKAGFFAPTQSQRSALEVLQRLLHMLSRLHKNYCAVSGEAVGAAAAAGANATNSGGSDESFQRTTTMRTSTAGGGAADKSTTNKGKGGADDGNGPNQQQQQQAPCRCHALATRIIKLVNPLTLIRTLKKRKEPEASEEEGVDKHSHKNNKMSVANQFEQIEMLLSPFDMGVCLEIVRDSFVFFGLEVFGPSMWTLRQVANFSLPSEKWCYKHLDVNPFAPIMVSLVVISHVKELILEGVGIIYVLMSLPSLKKTSVNHTTRLPQSSLYVHPLINSGCLRALAMCFSMFFSAIEPVLFRHRMYIHQQSPTNQNPRRRTMSNGPDPGTTSAAAAAAHAFSMRGRANSEFESGNVPGNVAASDITIPTFGRGHGSMYISSGRPTSAQSRESGVSLSDVGYDEGAATAAAELGAEEMGDDLGQLRNSCFEAVAEVVTLLMNMMLPFHGALACIADLQQAAGGADKSERPTDVNDASDIRIGKSPEEMLAAYILCDLAGIGPEGMGLQPPPRPPANQHGGAAAQRPTSPLSESSSFSGAGLEDRRRRMRGQSMASAAPTLVDDGISVAGFVEGAGITTCGALLGFLRFQSIVGLTQYHFTMSSLMQEQQTAGAGAGTASTTDLDPSSSFVGQHGGSALAHSFIGGSGGVGSVGANTAAGGSGGGGSTVIGSATEREAIKSLQKRSTWIFALITRLAAVRDARDEVKLRLIKAGMLETLCVCADPAAAVVIEHPRDSVKWSESDLPGTDLRSTLAAVQTSLGGAAASAIFNTKIIEDCMELARFHGNGSAELVTAVTQEYLRARASFNNESGLYHMSCNYAQEALQSVRQHLTKLGAISVHGDDTSHHHHKQQQQQQQQQNNRQGGGVSPSYAKSGTSQLKSGGAVNSARFAQFDPAIEIPFAYTLMCTQLLSRTFKYYFTSSNLQSGWLAQASMSQTSQSPYERNVAILTAVLANCLRRTHTIGSTSVTRIVHCVKELVRRLAAVAAQIGGGDDADNDYGDEDRDDEELLRNDIDSALLMGGGGGSDESELVQKDSAAANEIQAATLLLRAEKRVQSVLRRQGIVAPKGFALDTFAAGALMCSLATHAEHAVQMVTQHIAEQNDEKDRRARMEAAGAAATTALSSSSNPQHQHHQDDENNSHDDDNRIPMLGRRRPSLMSGSMRLPQQGTSIFNPMLGAGSSVMPGGLLSALQSGTAANRYGYATHTLIALADLMRLPVQSLVLLRTNPAAVEKFRFPPFIPVWFQCPNTWMCRMADEELGVLECGLQGAECLKLPCRGILDDLQKRQKEKPDEESKKPKETMQHQQQAAPTISITRPMTPVGSSAALRSRAVAFHAFPSSTNEESPQDRSRSNNNNNNNDDDAPSVPPSMSLLARKRGSLWGNASQLMAQTLDKKHESSERAQQEKLHQAQLAGLHSIGFLLCTISERAQAPDGAKRLGKKGSNAEYYDEVRVKIVEKESGLFSVQQAAKGYLHLKESKSGGDSSASGGGGQSTGGGGNSGLKERKASNMTSSGGGGQSSKGAAAEKDAYSSSVVLVRRELRVCIDQFNLLKERKRKLDEVFADADPDAETMNSGSTSPTGNKGGNNNSNNNTALPSAVQEMLQHFLIESRIESISAAETTARKQVHFEEDDERVQMLGARWSDGTLSGRGGGINNYNNNNITAQMSLRDAIQGLLNIEYSMRSSLCVAEVSAFESIELREERGRDRMFLQDAMKSMPAVLKTIQEQALLNNNNNGAIGRRVGLVNEAEEDAEFKRVLEEKRLADRALLRMRDSQSALFFRLRGDLERSESGARDAVEEQEDAARGFSGERAARSHADILSRATLIQFAALEMLEAEQRKTIAAQQADLCTQSENQLHERIADKPVFVHYCWAPHAVSASSGGGAGGPHHHNRPSSSHGLRVGYHPTPPPGSLGGVASRSNSRPSSAFARREQKPHGDDDRDSTLDDTLCAQAVTKALRGTNNNNNNNNGNNRPDTSPASLSGGGAMAVPQPKPSEVSLSLDLESVADLMSGLTTRSLLDPELTRSLKVLPVAYAERSKTLILPNEEEERIAAEMRRQEAGGGVLPTMRPGTAMSGSGIGGSDDQDHNNNNNQPTSASTIVVSPPRSFLVLDMSKHFLGDAGAQSLAEAIRGHSLRLVAIDVSNNGLTDIGAAALIEALRGSTTLVEANFSGNKRISSKAGRLFAKLAEDTPYMHRLHLEGTQVFRATLFIIQQLLETRAASIQAVVSNSHNNNNKLNNNRSTTDPASVAIVGMGK